MFKSAIAGLVVAVAMATGSSANASDFHVGFSSGPRYVEHCAPPVYYTQPVYYSAPVVYSAPVYYPASYYAPSYYYPRSGVSFNFSSGGHRHYHGGYGRGYGYGGGYRGGRR